MKACKQAPRLRYLQRFVHVKGLMTEKTAQLSGGRKISRENRLE